MGQTLRAGIPMVIKVIAVGLQLLPGFSHQLLPSATSQISNVLIAATYKLANNYV